MRTYETFVAPFDERPLAPPQPLDRPAVGDVDLQGWSVGDTSVGHAGDPMRGAQAFVVKYVAVSLVLLLLAIGIVWRMGQHPAWVLILFAGLAVGAYYALGRMELEYSAAGVARLRLQRGADVLLAKIDADREVRLAQLDVTQAQLDAQREYNRQIADRERRHIAHQLEVAERGQVVRNQVHGYVQPSCFARDELEPPPWVNTVRDTARRRLLDAIRAVYADMDSDGWLRNDQRVPWSKRSGHSEGDLRRMRQLLTDSGLAQYDEARRQWRIDVDRYPTSVEAIDGILRSPTLA